jgi:hypothetical protein
MVETTDKSKYSTTPESLLVIQVETSSTTEISPATEKSSSTTATNSKWSAHVAYQSSSTVSQNWPIYIGIGVLGFIIVLAICAVFWVNI